MLCVTEKTAWNAGTCENPAGLYSVDVSSPYCNASTPPGRCGAERGISPSARGSASDIDLSDKSFLGDGHLGILQLVNGAALSPWLEERAL